MILTCSLLLRRHDGIVDDNCHQNVKDGLQAEQGKGFCPKSPTQWNHCHLHRCRCGGGISLMKEEIGGQHGR